MQSNMDTPKGGVQVTWLPVVDSTNTQFIAESDSAFCVTTTNGNDVHRVQSEHDGLVHAVSVEVPVTGKVEVQR